MVRWVFELRISRLFQQISRIIHKIIPTFSYYILTVPRIFRSFQKFSCFPENFPTFPIDDGNSEVVECLTHNLRVACLTPILIMNLFHRKCLFFGLLSFKYEKAPPGTLMVLLWAYYIVDHIKI